METDKICQLLGKAVLLLLGSNHSWTTTEYILFLHGYSQAEIKAMEVYIRGLDFVKRFD